MFAVLWIGNDVGFNPPVSQEVSDRRRDKDFAVLVKVPATQFMISGAQQCVGTGRRSAPANGNHRHWWRWPEHLVPIIEET